MKKLILMFLMLCSIAAYGQNVTISPTTGKLIAALTDVGEVGFENGWSSMWRHEQLALSFTVADEPNLTEGGEIAIPAGNIIEYRKNNTVGNKLVLAGGMQPDLYMVLSLPKGYRIEGYRIVFLNNLNGSTVSGMTSTAQNKTVYETGSNFDYSAPKAQTPTMGTSNSDTREFVIERTNTDDDPMGNQLYFRLHHDQAEFFLLTIKHFEVYFTAEGTFSADVTPSAPDPVATSCEPIGFKTSKVDIGEVTLREKNGQTFYAYSYENVEDLMGYNYLYQEDAVSNGVPADVADDKHIHLIRNNSKNYFGLENDTYYVETPIEIDNSSSSPSPIGYRIVGAKIDYSYGVQAAAQPYSENYYTIEFTQNGTTYYLNRSGHFVTTKTLWEKDGDNGLHNGSFYLIYRVSYGDIYNYNNYQQRQDYIYTIGIGTSTSENKVKVDNNNRLYIEDARDFIYRTRRYTWSSWGEWYWSGNDFTAYLQRQTDPTIRPVFTSSTSNLPLLTSHSDVVNLPAFTPASYTLDVYDKTGETVLFSTTVESSADDGSFTFSDENEFLNNDAIKFRISGIESEGGMALVNVELYLQALDPYINKMDIVCHDPDDQLTLSQGFTADDFSVSGGVFNFYVPEQYATTDLTFTFSNLFSNYGDNTYYNGERSGNARYSFVRSDYFIPVDGDGDNGLYDSAYNPNANYTTKVFTSVAGNNVFRFNNADELTNTGSGDAVAHLEEYPFTVSKYLAGEGNQFIPVVLNASATKSGIYYVFTADETRYNIAPTTNWQHRFYAFYRMDINLEAKTYEPKLEWRKIYNNTCYYGTDLGKDQDATDSQWGLKVTTENEEGNEFKGYLNVEDIVTAINNGLGNNTSAPKSKDQILYIDGTELYSILSSDTHTLATLKEGLGKNCLIFLPENTTSTLDNFAYKTSSGAYHAGGNIVITDRKPFFSPYKIDVDAANYATYSREITLPKGYDKTTNATLMLPFTMTVDNGLHTNPGDNSQFTVNVMADNQTIALSGSQIDHGVAYFAPVTGTSTEANKPYMVKVEPLSSEENISFVARQKGATVEATPLPSDYKINGEQVTATYKGTTYYLTNKASYAGYIVDRAVTEDVFYFIDNKYQNLHLMSPNLQYLYVYPFRSTYAYSTSAPTGSTNMLKWIDVSYEYLGDQLDIAETLAKADLAVRSGIHTLTMEASKPQTVVVRSLNGMTVSTVTLEEGDCKTITLPAGIYVVNNVKIVVK